MKKLVLLSFSFVLFLSEANAGKRCQCKFQQTGWDKNRRVCGPSNGNYKPCLEYDTTCEAHGKKMGLEICGFDLQCHQIGTCND